MTSIPLFTAKIGPCIWDPASGGDDVVVFADNPHDILAGVGPSVSTPRIGWRYDHTRWQVERIEIGGLINWLIAAGPFAVMTVVSPHVTNENERYSADIANLREIVRANMSQSVADHLVGLTGGYLFNADKAAKSGDGAGHDAAHLGARRTIMFAMLYLEGTLVFAEPNIGLKNFRFPKHTPYGEDVKFVRKMVDTWKDESTLPKRVPAVPYRRWLYDLRLKLMTTTTPDEVMTEPVYPDDED